MITITPQTTTSAGINRVGPIVRRMRFEGSSDRMYGLGSGFELEWRRRIDISMLNAHKEH